MEQMSGARRSGRLLACFEKVAGDNGGEDAPTQLRREHVGAVEVTRREEDTMEAEEVEVAKEGVDPRTTPSEDRSRSLSLSRYPSSREGPAKSKDRRCRRCLTRTWPT
jgi:hypothetical protein